MDKLWENHVELMHPPDSKRARLLVDVVINWNNLRNTPGVSLWSKEFILETISLFSNVYRVIPPFKYAQSILDRSKSKTPWQIISDIAALTS